MTNEGFASLAQLKDQKHPLIVMRAVLACNSKVPKFMLFKFVILFQSFMPFSNPLVLSIIYQLLLPRHSLLSLSVHVISTPFLFNLHASTFRSKRHQQIVYSYTTSYQHTLQLFSFSLDVFHSLPPNRTNQIAASIT